MNISLFLGAGASVQFNMDTTAEFRNKLENNEQLNPKVNQNVPDKQTPLASLINNPNFRDVEELLYAIKELIKNITSPKDFSESAKLAWTGLTYPQLAGFKPAYESLTKILRSIEMSINEEVFNAYNWDEINNKDLTLFYSKLFKIILDNSKVINIGTANYDQAIEKFCGLPNSKYNCHDGFKMQDTNLEIIFSSDNFNLKNPDIDKTDVKLFKIHGSLNWSQTGDQIFKVFGAKSTIKPEERVFITPTLNPKEDVKKEPFNTLNNLFNKYLQESQICVIIGYSFRDEHINGNFDKFMKNPRNHLIIISPRCKSDFVRNYRGKNCTDTEMDEAWIKNNKPKNVHFLEYAIEKGNRETVLDELEKKISTIKSKNST